MRKNQCVPLIRIWLTAYMNKNDSHFGRMMRCVEQQGRTCDTCDLCGAYNTYELRQSVRAKYGIHGNPSDDAINVCCCSACVFCQDYAELVARDGGSSYMAN